MSRPPNRVLDDVLKAQALLVNDGLDAVGDEPPTLICDVRTLMSVTRIRAAHHRGPGASCRVVIKARTLTAEPLSLDQKAKAPSSLSGSACRTVEGCGYTS
jgi:hypothetical protein